MFQLKDFAFKTATPEVDIFNFCKKGFYHAESTKVF